LLDDNRDELWALADDSEAQFSVKCSVPELSRFYGIIIRMYLEVGARHHMPHFHAYYRESTAIFSINPIELMEGTMPRRQLRLIEAWAELHHDELQTDWERLQAGQSAFPIEPLR